MTYADKPDQTVKDALNLAESWQNRANALLTREEKTLQKYMAAFLDNPRDKAVMAAFIDQSFRSEDPERVAGQIKFLMQKYGVPDFFSAGDKLLMRIFLGIGHHFPHVSIPRVMAKMRDDSSRSVIPGEKRELKHHLETRAREGVIMNINHLGEAVLGEDEALTRLRAYENDLKDPLIQYISVKISTIYSQISSLAFDHTVAVLEERLSRLLRTARENCYTRMDGSQSPKFVNLDMEEYRDLEITVAAFTRTLDHSEFVHVSAGLALQAYLPDSYPIQQALTRWARDRVNRGGAPIKIRIVKGANLEMEKVESALRNWPLAPYDNKPDVDAAFKRMIRYGLRPENIRAAHIGVGSHNLFDQAYAYVLARNNHVLEHFSVEMLEGMADHVRRAVQETTGNLVLYAPVANREQFVSAIAYLIRRLDENTGEENFLRHACHLEPGGRTWQYLKDQFLRSLGHNAREGSFRTQDRNAEDFRDAGHPFLEGRFRNEPDTDWSLAPNRAWARSIRGKWMKGSGDAPLQVPLVFSGREVFSGRHAQSVVDTARKDGKEGAHPVVALWARATEQDLKSAVGSAKADPGGWRNLPPEDRRNVLKKAAVEIRRARGDLIGAAAAEGGKVFYESDGEVSEAVDFVEYYSRAACDLKELKGVTFHGRGVGVVLSPWNFPIAIPCGGIAASLAAGNTVLIKPASSAVLTAWVLCGCFWRAGIDQHTLQFVPCPGETSGHILTTHPDVDYVIFTGGTETGLKIQKARPQGLLAAETGGKNATIVTAMSDRDQAIKNVVYSAFGHSGQKCSATSLLILERPVYEDRNFLRQLVDAARSYAAGSPWEFQHRTGPLIRPPSGDLKWALTELDTGESWALKPEMKEDNPSLWTPGIKLGVRPGSRSHMTEFFGPVLSVLKAENLDEAIDLVNATGYGLTSALESLDPREQDHWQKRVRAGNLYINRGTTGAMVLRQPFGGMGKSALGAGVKVGGPNYLLQFMNFDGMGFPEAGALISESSLLTIVQEWETKLFWGRLNVWRKDLERVVLGIRSCLYRMETEFSRENDYFNLRGQDNIFRYRPYDRVILRLHEKDTLFEVLVRVAAARIAGCKTLLSVQAGLCSGAVEFFDTSEGMRFLEGLVPQEQTEDELIGMLAENPLVRYAAPDRVPMTIHEAAAERGCHISRDPVLMEGRLEMRHYFQEQSLCNSYHRYGNLGDRTLLKSRFIS
ncbi:aldehyde dehydrogenase (NAD) family protein [delta proteobacterium NaphS2]|nr:aldehyde dehydrogenase (NAD) family protein [delta proteobacterium NaphS2]